MPKSTTKTSIVTYPPPDLPPNPKSYDWKYFKRRLENHFQIADTPGFAKLPILLNCLGYDGLAIYDGLPEPKADYANALLRLNSYFDAGESTMVFRKEFYKARQSPEESITQFACRLRRLSMQCDFINSSEMLRNIFVLGVKNDGLGERLMSEDIKTLTFDRAVAKAECFERGSAGRRQINVTSSEVNRLKTDMKQIGPSRDSVTFGKFKCYRCGSPSHKADNPMCKAKNAECRSCGKRGHFAAVCRSKQTTANKSSSSRRFAVKEVTMDDMPDEGLASMARVDQGYGNDLEDDAENNNLIITCPSQNASVTEEKFRVDRKKLEDMLQGLNLEVNSNAESFFDKIMKATGTQISWPSRLKIGAKSRKDPHIKVAGKPDAVFQAKEKIMQVLDSKTNRVTLKIDVSHTDHSHAIGKGGRSVKEVSTDTQCHIHFPDSNRTNPMEKSNQVTISGLPEGVERARRRIRDMLPVIFCFDFPFNGIPNLLDVQRDTFLQQIEKQFDVQVTYKHRPKPMVCVKGVVENATRTKEAANLVLRHHYREMATRVMVSLSIEVDPKHLPFVRPQVEKVNLASTISFPDATSPGNRKSTLTITGSIENVYECRQFVVGCLPVFLIFDVNPEDCNVLESVELLEEKFDVNIIIKPRTKQQGKSVVIRTTERNVMALYESRCALLSLDPGRDGNVPTSKQTTDPLSSSVQNLQQPGNNSLFFMPRAPSSAHLLLFPLPQVEQTGRGWHEWNEQTPVATPIPGAQPMETTASSSPLPTPLNGCGEGNGDFPVNTLSCSSSSSSSGIESDADPTSNASKQAAPTIPSDRRAPGAEYSIKQRELRQLLTQTTDYDEKKAVARRKIRQELSSKPRIPNDEWVGQGFSFSLPTAALREATAKASPANQHAIEHLGAFPELQTGQQTTHVWPNGIFMQSCVESGFAQLFDKDLGGGMAWNESVEIVSNKMIAPAVPDLTEFLCKLGLGKYADILSQHEVDLPTFMTLSDNDLKELGINTFGARRKMLMAIQELQQLMI